MINGSKRLVVITMVGGTDLIGELEGERLERPFIILRMPQTQQAPAGGLALSDMMKNGVFSGDSIQLNMDNWTWIATPSAGIAKAYKAQRSGLLVANMAAAVNE